MTNQLSIGRDIVLHGAVLAVLFGLSFALPGYHQALLARLLVLASYAVGYNLLFGYGGLTSLGSAMFFAAGLYGAALAVNYLNCGVVVAFLVGLASGAVLSLLVGALALRATGVAFMIVTMMFAQIFYLVILYLREWTGGDEGFVLSQSSRVLQFGAETIDMTSPTVRYMSALLLFAIVLLSSWGIVRSRFGRVLVATRENEARAAMLGYNTVSTKLIAIVASGVMCASAGASYVLLFGYAGASFASVQYSILPLLWVLLGGAATTLGPLIGTIVMSYLIDIISGHTSSYMMVVGVALILLILFFPRGILGSVRQRWVPWIS